MKTRDRDLVTLAVTVPDDGRAELRPPAGYVLVDVVHQLAAGDHQLTLQRDR